MYKHSVFLSLGSNINRIKNIQNCLIALQKQFGDVTSSPVYESEPVGFNGEFFYNLTVKITTSLSLKDLSQALKKIEDEQGRIRAGKKFSSRTLDIDILTYDSLCGIHEGIELPRPELFYNGFVLLPMVDLAAQEIEPKSKLSYFQLWEKHSPDILKKQKLWKIEFDWPPKIKLETI